MSSGFGVLRLVGITEVVIDLGRLGVHVSDETHSGGEVDPSGQHLPVMRYAQLNPASQHRDIDSDHTSRTRIVGVAEIEKEVAEHAPENQLVRRGLPYRMLVGQEN